MGYLVKYLLRLLLLCEFRTPPQSILLAVASRPYYRLHNDIYYKCFLLIQRGRGGTENLLLDICVI